MDLDRRGFHLGALRGPPLPGRLRRVGGRALHLAREVVGDGRAHDHDRVDVTPTTTSAPTTTSGGTTKSSGGGGGSAAAGQAVFAANGCASCHTFKPANATGTIGPNLDTAPASDAKADNNMDLAAFIKESIEKPDAYIAKGYSKGIMPTTFGKSLSGKQLNDLVAFIVSGSSSS